MLDKERADGEASSNWERKALQTYIFKLTATKCLCETLITDILYVGTVYVNSDACDGVQKSPFLSWQQVLDVVRGDLERKRFRASEISFLLRLAWSVYRVEFLIIFL